jgi:hypothetical protein
MACDRYSPSSFYQKYKFGFHLYKVAKWSVNGKPDSTVIGQCLGLKKTFICAGVVGLFLQ